MPWYFSRSAVLWLFLLLLPNFCLPLRAQERRGAFLNRPLVLQMASHSGYIFAGKVTSIALVKPKRPNEIAIIRITFHVERGMRGVRSGQSLSIREWCGLWQAGEHYRVGERLLLFLYPASKLGLTSPVGGDVGRIVLDSDAEAALVEAQVEALIVDPDAPLRGRFHPPGQDPGRRPHGEVQE